MRSAWLTQQDGHAAAKSWQMVTQQVCILAEKSASGGLTNPNLRCPGSRLEAEASGSSALFVGAATTAPRFIPPAECWEDGWGW